MSALTVLAVHGVGGQSSITDWENPWRGAINQGIKRIDASASATCEFVKYDFIFENHGISSVDVLEAAVKLLGSGLSSLFRSRAPVERGVQNNLRWTAGMVVQWVENDAIREATRKHILEQIENHEPDVVVAHSLGSLICYDTFLTKEGAKAIKDRYFISFGSQIAHPFVARNLVAGRLTSIPAAKKWFNLFNRYDRVFTQSINLRAANFEQVPTDFGSSPFDGLLDHDAVEYLSHKNASYRAWSEILGDLNDPSARSVAIEFGEAVAKADVARGPTKKALIVGINAYRNPEMHLEGCVNDAFLVSAALQECGFQPDEIRLVLDQRATAKMIRDSLEWLLTDVGPNDQRVFFFSGHGAQIPASGEAEGLDCLDECLVPVDFDWQHGNAIIDDDLYDLYTQLPYDSYFVMFLDCCHSGGMVRGTQPAVRGIDPPDDLRHQLLRWDVERQMWVPRDLKSITRDLLPEDTDEEKAEEIETAYLGSQGSTRRFGRAAPLRALDWKKYDQIRSELDHKGPYLPVIFQACQEHQYAYEYRHGNISYGAFTYCLAKILRQYGHHRFGITFEQIVSEAKRELADLGYSQEPLILGPAAVLKQPLPWGAQPAPAKKSTRRRRSR